MHFVSPPNSLEPTWIFRPGGDWLAISGGNGVVQVAVQGIGTGSYLLGMQVMGAGDEQSDAIEWETAPGQIDSFDANTTTAEFVSEQLTNEAVAVGTVQLQGRPAAPSERLQIPVQVTITPDGQSPSIFDETVTLDTQGRFTVRALHAGAYRIRVKNVHTLSSAQTVALAVGENTIQVGMLREGDTDGNNLVNLTDFSLLAVTFGRQAGDAGFDARADFNGDAIVNLLDFSLLASNFGQSGVS